MNSTFESNSDTLVIGPGLTGSFREVPPAVSHGESSSQAYGPNQSANIPAHSPTTQSPTTQPPIDERHAKLIDLNTIIPNGSTESLNSLLTALSEKFGGVVSLGQDKSSGIKLLCAENSKGENSKGENSKDRKGSQAQQVHTLLSSALLEAARCQEACHFAVAKGQSSAMLQQLRVETNSALLLSFCVTDGLGLIVRVPEGGTLKSKEEYSAIINAVKAELPTWITIWDRVASAAKSEHLRGRINAWLKRRDMIALGTVLAMGSLFLPFPYWPQRRCLVEPAVRHFVSSPVAGRVVNSAVRPGDLVAEGQVLAKLDDERVQWELATAEAELQSASKRRDSALASRSGGELRAAQLEQEKAALEIDALEQQLSELEVAAKSSGVIVQGDWYRSEGAPIDRGETLFEIASLDRMRVEVQLSTADLGVIRVGHPVTLRVESAPRSYWNGTITRIDPRAQVIDSSVVFIAEFETSNPEQLLRPGMEGSVRISAGTQPLGWILFHRPYQWLARQFTW